MMATNTSPLEVTTVRRKGKDGSSSEVSCPACIKMYNQYMGGVDKSDQLRGYYPIRTKCHKFYK